MTQRPHILVTRDRIEGLRCVDDLAQVIAHPHGQNIWRRLLERADEAVTQPPLVPASRIPGREEQHIKHANPDYTICHAASGRVLCSALAHLVTNDNRYRDAALRQVECLFDESQWPEWRDAAHRYVHAGLRTGSISSDLGLAYDWLHAALTPAQRAWFVEGIDRCGLSRFWRSVEANDWCVNAHNNWLTVLVGGVGIAAMALAEDYSRSAEVIDFALPRLRKYLDVIGPEGEFNESISYANAMLQPTAFFAAYRYHTAGGDNPLARWPFPDTCRWVMPFILSPGHLPTIGDAHIGRPPVVTHFAAIADAANDGTIQDFYLRHAAGADRPALELLWFNANLRPRNPEGVVPRCKAFRAHSGCIVSRTDWDYDRTRCIVTSKAGHGAEGHGHHDNGQVLVDAYNRPLLIDPGVYPYPPDFFGKNRYAYYFASVRGHNVPQIGNHETRTTSADVAHIEDATFDERCGGRWTLNLTNLYSGATRVRRSVVHQFVGLVAVLDEIELEAEDAIAIRWHTATPTQPHDDGSFRVVNGDVALAALVTRIDDENGSDGGGLTLTHGEHAFAPPFDKTRMGEPLECHHETYIDAGLTGRRCRVLSLFCVFGPGQAPDAWRREGGVRRINGPDGVVEVTIDRGEIVTSGFDAGTVAREGSVPRAR